MGFLKNLFKKSEYRAVETIEIDEHLRQIMGLVTDTQTALNIPAVSACVDFISSKIAELPIKLYHEKDGKTSEIINDIRLVLLNDSTGDLLDSYQMKKAFVRDYLLHGAGYILPERNGNEFVSLRFIANENVTVTKNYDPIYKVARYQIGTRTFFDDEIMRICRNTKDGVTGIGIIQEHADILNAAYKQIVYERYLVERGGNKKGFIQVDDRVTQEVLDDLKEKWRTLYSSDNSNMMVLNKGLKFVESSNTSVEMQLNESKDTNNELICEMFGLSSKIISGTASDEEYISAIKVAIMPVVVAIQTALNKSLLLWAEKSDHYFTLDTKELLKGDILKRYQAYQIALKEGFLQLDEVRYEEDKEPYGLQFIKLGLQDVLFDPKTRTIYTPNTNQTAVLGEKVVDNSSESAIIETRYSDSQPRDDRGRWIDSGGGGSSSGGGSAVFRDSNFDEKEITDDTIAKVPFVKIFDDETKDKAYQKANEELLTEAKKYPVGTEVSIVYDKDMKPIENHDYVVGKIGGGEVHIDDPDMPYHAFHNHPTDNTLSADDLIGLTERSNMLSITVAGNGGKVYCMKKTDISKPLAYKMFLQQQSKQKIFLGKYSYLDIKFEKVKESNLSKSDAETVIQQLSSFSDKCAKAGAFYGFDYRQK